MRGNVLLGKHDDDNRRTIEGVEISIFAHDARVFGRNLVAQLLVFYNHHQRRLLSHAGRGVRARAQNGLQRFLGHSIGFEIAAAAACFQNAQSLVHGIPFRSLRGGSLADSSR